jgi:hypothetical protein
MSCYSQGVQWGFFQCEPDVWIVITVDTQTSAIEQGGSFCYYQHSANGEGLVQAIEVWAMTWHEMICM